MMIIETHAHYDDEAFDADREELLKELPEKGIGRVINVGASMRTTRNSIALAEKYPFIYAAVGVHPDDVEELNEENMEELRRYCCLKKTVAVGEIGLDYYWHKEPEHQKLQQYWFRRQLSLAREEKLPFIIHSRDAAQDTFEILKQENAGEIGGVVTFKNARKLKEVAADIPLDRILLETDSPYMAPTPYRGKRNCSLYLPYVAEEIARLRGITTEEVIEATEANARRVFAKLV